METERIGLYGGSFSPPHYGHIHAAEAAISALGLSKLIIMPFYSSPHKPDTVDGTPDERLRLCRAAFAGIDKVEVSSYEIDLGRMSYTCETLEHFAEAGRELYLVVGGDMLDKLPKWKRSETVFSLATIVCVPRTEGEYCVLSAKKDEFERKNSCSLVLLGTKPTDVSSTMIREKIRKNENVSAYLPESVTRMIEKENLYR